ncbi:zinc finger protein [Macleaya cordata]|uniref:E3 ubiquitin-protein ligase RMA n=1 Tax=Macleaya cordata TaxID=56857 RepID=A0A200PQV8_MACCD|nr:zinc finger protein [Macleaya cordata]
MAMEQYFHEIVAQQDGDSEGSQPQKWKSVSATAATSSLDNTANACFDCNICLENAHDPVVTLCGHLYCWPCIYKWLHLQNATNDPDQQPLCPVCKADVSVSTLVPLYGRGRGQSSPSQTESESKGPFPGLRIPCRPSACGVHALITTSTSPRPSHRQLHHRNLFDSQTQQHHHHQQPYTNPQPMFNLGGTTAMNAFYPMVEMFGEMVYARVFGNSEASMFRFQYPMSSRNSSTSYYQAGSSSSSPRVRRQEMQTEKSLNRISIFLFCCFVLCLLLF